MFFSLTGAPSTLVLGGTLAVAEVAGGLLTFVAWPGAFLVHLFQIARPVEKVEELLLTFIGSGLSWLVAGGILSKALREGSYALGHRLPRFVAPATDFDTLKRTTKVALAIERSFDSAAWAVFPFPRSYGPERPISLRRVFAPSNRYYFVRQAMLQLMHVPWSLSNLVRLLLLLATRPRVVILLVAAFWVSFQGTPAAASTWLAQYLDVEGLRTWLLQVPYSQVLAVLALTSALLFWRSSSRVKGQAAWREETYKSAHKSLADISHAASKALRSVDKLLSETVTFLNFRAVHDAVAEVSDNKARWNYETQTATVRVPGRGRPLPQWQGHSTGWPSTNEPASTTSLTEEFAVRSAAIDDLIENAQNQGHWSTLLEIAPRQVRATLTWMRIWNGSSRRSAADSTYWTSKLGLIDPRVQQKISQRWVNDFKLSMTGIPELSDSELHAALEQRLTAEAQSLSLDLCDMFVSIIRDRAKLEALAGANYRYSHPTLWSRARESVSRR